MEHTKGPWIINDNGGNGVLIEAEDWEVAVVHNAGAECLSYEVQVEAMANAKLITSAPELLEVLQEELKELEEWNGNGNYSARIEKIKSVIKKATK